MAVLKPQEGSSYDQVPDVIPPINAGIYDMECLEADVKDNKNKDGFNLVTSWKVVNAADESQNGRRATQYTSTKQDTSVKRIFTSCGVKPEADGGYNTDNLKGRVARVVIAPEAYTDPTTGMVKESSRIKEFLIPGDAGFNPAG